MVHDLGYEEMRQDRDGWRDQAIRLAAKAADGGSPNYESLYVDAWAYANKLRGHVIEARDENLTLRAQLDEVSNSLEDARDDLEHYKNAVKSDNAEEWKRKYWEAQAELDGLYDDRTKLMDILDPPPEAGFTVKWHPGAETLSALWKSVGYTTGPVFSTP